MLAEAVWNACFYVGYDVRLGVDGKWDFAAIRTEVVHAAYVVVMTVGDEQRVEVKVGGAEHLLPEIGAAVNQQADALRAHDGGAARGSADLHTSHSHPNCGTPVDVPVPRNSTSIIV